MNIENMSLPEMATMYNEIAAKTGQKPVNKFKDKSTGIRRLTALLDGEGKVSKKTLQEEFGDSDLPALKPKKSKKERVKKNVEPVEVDVDSASSIYAAFGLRQGTNLERAVDYLIANIDKYVSAKDLIKATYGNKDMSLGALLMVLEGAKVRISTRDLPLELRRERSEPKNPRIGLFVK